MFEDEITLFNKKYDADTRDYEYIRTYLKGVNVEKNKAVNVIKSGLENASSGMIYIPSEDLDSEEKSYISPKQYQQLASTTEDSEDEEEEDTETAETVEDYYTLQEGDIIVIGIIDYTIDDNNTLTNLKSTYDDVYEITSVDDKRKGDLQHWEVALK